MNIVWEKRQVKWLVLLFAYFLQENWRYRSRESIQGGDWLSLRLQFRSPLQSSNAYYTVAVMHFHKRHLDK